MGCRLIIGSEQGCHDDRAVFFCSTTEVAFGPVFRPEGDWDAQEHAEKFEEWLKGHPTIVTSGISYERETSDPRHYRVGDLIDLHSQFVREVRAKAENAARKAVDCG